MAGQLTSFHWDRLDEATKRSKIKPKSKISVGKRHAWRAVDDFEDQVWAQFMLPKLTHVFNENIRSIFGSRRKKCFVNFKCYMTSSEASWQDATPTVVVSSTKPKYALKTVSVLTSNPIIIRENSGFDFYADPSPADDIQIAGSGSQAAAPLSQSSSDLTTLCGVRILIPSQSRRESSQWRHATLGGLIQVGDSCYGLTTAHAFGSSVSGQASDDSETDSNTSASASDSEDMRTSAAESRRSAATDTIFYLSDSTQPASQPDQELKHAKVLGEVRASYQHGAWLNYDHDWALIKLSSFEFQLPNTFQVDGRSVTCSAIATEAPRGEVAIIAGLSGTTRRKATGQTIGMFFPDALGMVNAWIVEGTSQQGDCGSWVVDVASGNVYGMLVASSQRQNCTYCLSMSNILQSISTRLGQPEPRIFDTEKTAPEGSLVNSTPIHTEIRSHPIEPDTTVADVDSSHGVSKKQHEPAKSATGARHNSSNSRIDKDSSVVSQPPKADQKYFSGSFVKALDEVVVNEEAPEDTSQSSVRIARGDVYEHDENNEDGGFCRQWDDTCRVPKRKVSREMLKDYGVEIVGETDRYFYLEGSSAHFLSLQLHCRHFDKLRPQSVARNPSVETIANEADSPPDAQGSFPRVSDAEILLEDLPTSSHTPRLGTAEQFDEEAAVVSQRNDRKISPIREEVSREKGEIIIRDKDSYRRPSPQREEREFIEIHREDEDPRSHAYDSIISTRRIVRERKRSRSQGREIIIRRDSRDREGRKRSPTPTREKEEIILRRDPAEDKDRSSFTDRERHRRRPRSIEREEIIIRRDHAEDKNGSGYTDRERDRRRQPSLEREEIIIRRDPVEEKDRSDHNTSRRFGDHRERVTRRDDDYALVRRDTDRSFRRVPDEDADERYKSPRSYRRPSLVRNTDEVADDLIRYERRTEYHDDDRDARRYRDDYDARRTTGSAEHGWPSDDRWSREEITIRRYRSPSPSSRSRRTSPTIVRDSRETDVRTDNVNDASGRNRSPSGVVNDLKSPYRPHSTFQPKEIDYYDGPAWGAALLPEEQELLGESSAQTMSDEATRKKRNAHVSFKTSATKRDTQGLEEEAQVREPKERSWQDDRRRAEPRCSRNPLTRDQPQRDPTQSALHTQQRFTYEAGSGATPSIEESLAEADFYQMMAMPQGCVNEASECITQKWGSLHLPPGTVKATLEGAGGAAMVITWQGLNGTRRCRFLPGGLNGDEHVNRISHTSQASRDDEKREEIIEQRAEDPKPDLRLGNTKMPKRLVEVKVLRDLGYEYEEQDKTIVVKNALSPDQIDQIISDSFNRRARKSQRNEKALEFKVSLLEYLYEAASATTANKVDQIMALFYATTVEDDEDEALVEVTEEHEPAWEDRNEGSADRRNHQARQRPNAHDYLPPPPTSVPQDQQGSRDSARSIGTAWTVESDYDLAATGSWSRVPPHEQQQSISASYIANALSRGLSLQQAKRVAQKLEAMPPHRQEEFMAKLTKT